jgi:hypothetical protein
VKRKGFALAAVVSLVLCLITAALWVRSCSRIGSEEFGSPHGYAIVVDNNGAMVWPPPHERWKHPEPVAFIPYGGVLYLFSLPSVLWLVTRFIFRRRQPGLCRRCGYNLTGNTSGVCPECGTPVPKEAAEKSPSA